MCACARARVSAVAGEFGVVAVALAHGAAGRGVAHQLSADGLCLVLREYTAEIMFETFGVKGLYIAVSAVLALAASWTSKRSQEKGLAGVMTGLCALCPTAAPSSSTHGGGGGAVFVQVAFSKSGTQSRVRADTGAGGSKLHTPSDPQPQVLRS